MPRLTAEPLFAAEGLRVRRVTCDGVDEILDAEERSDDAQLILVLQGRFAFQDSRTRAIASPSTALFLDDGHRYRIRHLEGGDVCVALQGDLCAALGASGPTARAISAESYVRMQGLAAKLGSTKPVSRLEVEETLCTALAPEPAATAPTRRARDREMAGAIAYRLERDVDARLALRDLVAGSGNSLFHACRVFRRETGFSIHRYQQEIRLRHALALLLDTDRPVALIAAELGFANQGHLTNLFRRRFRTTPARARKQGLPRTWRTTSSGNASPARRSPGTAGNAP